MIRPTFEKLDSNFNFQNYSFDCGVEDLNKFFYKNAKDFIKEDYSQLYVSIMKETSEIVGFFTLSCTSIRSEEKKLISIEKIARYIPGLLLGMFAVDKKYQGKDVGIDLIKKAVHISLKTSMNVGCRCLIVDSKVHKELIKFYQKIGFEFVNLSLGSKILQKLKDKIDVKRDSIKLFLDFHKVRRTAIS